MYESLRVVFDDCGVGVLVVNAGPKGTLSGPITYVNSAFCRLTDFARQELEGKPARSFFSGQLPDADRINSGVDTSSRAPVVLNFKRKNSSEVQLRGEVWLIRDAELATDYIAFQHSAWPLHLPLADSVGNQTQACIFTTDLDGTVTSWNRGAANATGFSAEEMLGRDIRTLCTSPGSSCLPDNIIELLQREPSFDFSLPFRRKDGGVSTRAFSISLLRDSLSTPSGFLSVSVDITDLARQDKALRESSQLLDAIQRLQRQSMSGGDVRLILHESLSTLLRMTNSEHGFCGEVRRDSDGQAYVRADTIQTTSTNPDILRFFQPYIRNGVDFRNQSTLIGRVVKSGQNVLTNRPHVDAMGGGFPPGHPPLSSFVGLPLITSAGVIGIVGLANRPGGYDESLLIKLQPLLDCCASIIEFCRTRDRATALIEMFQRSFANTRDALVVTNSQGEITDWNPAAEKLLGYSRNEAVGMSILALCGEGLREFSNVASTIREDGHWENTITFHRRDGSEVIAEAGCHSVASEGTELFMFVIRDVTWRRQAEEALKEAGDRFDAFAQNSRCAFWIATADTKQVLYTSPAIRTIAGLDPPIEPQRWDKLIHPDDIEEFQVEAARFFETGIPLNNKYRIILPDGRIRWIQSNAFSVRDARGDIYRFAGLLEDVTEYEEAVAKVHSALSEKEALLKEIHHRVKNNLQIISSLLRLQATTTSDTNCVAFLQESRNRVETIALLHEYLHQSENLSFIDFSTYVRRLVTKLMSVNPTGENVKVDFDIEPLSLDSQTIVLCGLILNELLSNSLRHAFPDGRKGKINIRVHTEGGRMILMSLSDNGLGLPKGFDIERVSTLGLRLVRRLTRQLGGTVSISNQRGVNVDIEFPWPARRPLQVQESA